MTTGLVVLGFIALFVTNFVSVFIAVGTMKWLDDRRKRKIAEMLMEEIGEQISTEINFRDIVRRFEQTEGERDK